jgi:hypothetical protein
MSDAPDLEALARRYLDLWQDQMAAMANDPAVVEALSRTFALMTQGAAAFAHAAEDAPRPSDRDAPGGGESSHGDPDGPAPNPAATPGRKAAGPDGRSGGAAPGTAASGLASGDSGMDVSDLLRRIDALEQRVAVLDARLRDQT